MCIVYCFDICMHCEMITKIKLINIPSPHIVPFSFFVCVVRALKDLLS